MRMSSQEFTATEEDYYAGSVNWNLLFSSGITQDTLDTEQNRVYKLQYRPMFLDKSGKSIKYTNSLIHKYMS